MRFFASSTRWLYAAGAPGSSSSTSTWDTVSSFTVRGTGVIAIRVDFDYAPEAPATGAIPPGLTTFGAVFFAGAFFAGAAFFATGFFAGTAFFTALAGAFLAVAFFFFAGATRSSSDGWCTGSSAVPPGTTPGMVRSTPRRGVSNAWTTNW